MGPTVLFIHLKIILLQYFYFSVISGIQIDPKYFSKFMLIFEDHKEKKGNYALLRDGSSVL